MANQKIKMCRKSTKKLLDNTLKSEVIKPTIDISEEERKIKNTNRNLIMSIVGYYKKVVETRDELIGLIKGNSTFEN